MSNDYLNEPLLTPKEAARLLCVDEETLAKWRRYNSRVPLPFLKISHRVVRYRKVDVHAYLDTTVRGGGA